MYLFSRVQYKACLCYFCDTDRLVHIGQAFIYYFI